MGSGWFATAQAGQDLATEVKVLRKRDCVKKAVLGNGARATYKCLGVPGSLGPARVPCRHFGMPVIPRRQANFESSVVVHGLVARPVRNAAIY